MGKLERNLPNDAYEAATNANAPSALNPFVTEVDAAVGAASLILYPTTAASAVPTYNKLVNAITDPDYDDPAVDLSTGAITGVAQLIGEFASEEGVISGNPGTVNVNTIGNIRRASGSGTATFYFEIYHRDNLGTETLLGTSNATYDATSAVYEQFFASALITGITFGPTDRVVTKWYANRVPGASDPTYEIQIGGATPVKITFPVPLASLPTGGVDGSGTTNYIPKWTPDGDTLGDSQIRDDGNTVAINGVPTTDYQLLVFNDAVDRYAIAGVGNANATTNIGVYGGASGGTGNTGLFGLADGGAIGTAIGVRGTANNLGTLPSAIAVGAAFTAAIDGIAGDVYGSQIWVGGTNDLDNNIGLYVNASNPGVGSHWAAQFVDGNEGAGKVLTSDAQGRATWQTPSGGGGASWEVEQYAYNMVPSGSINPWNGTSVAAAGTGTLDGVFYFRSFAGVGGADGTYFNIVIPDDYTPGADLKVSLKTTINGSGGDYKFFVGFRKRQTTFNRFPGDDSTTEWQSAAIAGQINWPMQTLDFVFSGTGVLPLDAVAILIYRDPSDVGDTISDTAYVNSAIVREN